MVFNMASLDLIADSYKTRYQWDEHNLHTSFDALFRHYVKKHRQEIVDSIALGIALEALLDGDAIDIDALPNNVKEAFYLAFPNVSIDSLNERSHEELLGFVNAWKGKLFEVEVQDQLNAGMQVGDYQLEAGQHAELAESATQPGWDLKILNDDGTTADLIQLKSTDSASYIHEALDRYPDVPIIATSDIGSHADTSDAVSTADLSNDDTTSQIHEVIGDDDTVTDAISHTAPAIIIAGMEWWQVKSGKKTIEQAVNSGGQRLVLSAAAGLVGATAISLIGPFGLLFGIGTRYWLGNKMRNLKDKPQARYEKEINPRPKLKNRRKPVSKAHARKAFKELENITDRLRLTYQKGTI